jgi:hypothetical protein
MRMESMPLVMMRRSCVPRLLRGMVGCGLLCMLPLAQADVATGIDSDAGLPFWELREPGMTLRLVQRLPDQTRAFFMARGFARADIEPAADNCVFQTIFRNVSQGGDAGPLEYDLGDWSVNSAGSERRMQTREHWAEEWARRGIAKPARIAFEWALYPTRQTYNPGDYNWGMSVFGLQPGSRFDLTVVWRQGGERRSARIEGLQCAPDVGHEEHTEAARPAEAP